MRVARRFAVYNLTLGLQLNSISEPAGLLPQLKGT
jgi:hypothetical protein